MPDRAANDVSGTRLRFTAPRRTRTPVTPADAAQPHDGEMRSVAVVLHDQLDHRLWPSSHERMRTGAPRPSWPPGSRLEADAMNALAGVRDFTEKSWPFRNSH
jgi:hypothetical protein